MKYDKFLSTHFRLVNLRKWILFMIALINIYLHDLIFVNKYWKLDVIFINTLIKPSELKCRNVSGWDIAKRAKKYSRIKYYSNSLDKSNNAFQTRTELYINNITLNFTDNHETHGENTTFILFSSCFWHIKILCTVSTKFMKGVWINVADVNGIYKSILVPLYTFNRETIRMVTFF